MENSTFHVFLLITCTIATISATSFYNANTDKLCKKSERKALLRFKEDLKDPMNNLFDWVGNGDCCSSTSVDCDNSIGYVHGLHVSSLNFNYSSDYNSVMGYGLGDKINPSLLELKHLKHLDLSRNNIFSSICHKLHISLVTLDLSDNYNLGPLMAIWLFSLTNLESLYLQVNNFKGPIPSGRTNWTRLKILNMSENSFISIIPPWMFGFKHLEYLDLSSTVLKGNIPSAIGNLSSINTTLQLSRNQLEGKLPNSLESLYKLKELSFDDNSFNGAVSKIFRRFSRCAIDALEVLDLGTNQLSGQLIKSLGKLSSLKYFDISHNQLNGSFPVKL
nr:receptor-like protein 12 [Ziziphus jujuba var. spinosa]